MSRRKKKKHDTGESELNLAAMLDMAFQLLTFFILTFKPSPIEGQINLRMPPPQPVTNVKGQSAGSADTNNPVSGLNTLVISALPNGSGALGSMAVGESTFGALGNLETHLQKALSDESSPFEQVVIQVGSGLRYDALMSVIDICTRQTLKDGKKLTKLSFVELPDK